MFANDLNAYNDSRNKLISYVGTKVKVWYFEEKEKATIINVDLNRNELTVHLDCERLDDDFNTPTKDNKPIYHIPFTHFNNYGLEFIEEKCSL